MLEKYLNKKQELLKNGIRELYKVYNGEPKILKKLEEYYTALEKIKQKTNNFDLVYSLRSEGIIIENIYFKEKFYDVNEEEIRQKKYYTLEEAENIIKWTVNYTRKGLHVFDKKRDLTGCCGLSQCASLYPLTKLGLKVTLNNIGDIVTDHRHAFGTVTIPVVIDGNVINKEYLIDCTYAQFFNIDNNLEVTEDRQMSGYYQKKDYPEFSKQLLEDGYVAFNIDTISKYFNGFIKSSTLNKEYDIYEIYNNVKNEERPINYDFSFEELEQINEEFFNSNEKTM